ARDTQSTQIIAQQSRIISESENSNSVFRQQINKLSGELDNKENIIRSIKEEEAVLFENQTQLRDEITDLSARLKESEQELSRRDKELDKLQTANIQAFERIERLRISVDMAEKDNSGLKQVNQELKNDFEFLQRQLHDVQNS